MNNKRSPIADEIVANYRREKEWKEKADRMKQMKQNKIIILAEHSREPLIIEKEDK